jgi:hypothetical protein
MTIYVALNAAKLFLSELWKLDQWRMRKMKESEQYSKLLETANVSLMSADEVHMRTIKPKNKKYKNKNGRRSLSPILFATITRKS